MPTKHEIACAVRALDSLLRDSNRRDRKPFDDALHSYRIAKAEMERWHAERDLQVAVEGVKGARPTGEALDLLVNRYMAASAVLVHVRPVTFSQLLEMSRVCADLEALRNATPDSLFSLHGYSFAGHLCICMSELWAVYGEDLRLLEQQAGEGEKAA